MHGLCTYSWPWNHNCSRCPAWTPASQAGSSGRSQTWRMRNTWRGRRRRSCSRESSSFSKDQCRSHCCSGCLLSWRWWGYCKGHTGENRSEWFDRTEKHWTLSLENKVTAFVKSSCSLWVLVAYKSSVLSYIITKIPSSCSIKDSQ